MNSRQQSCTDSQGFLLRHSTQENLPQDNLISLQTVRLSLSSLSQTSTSSTFHHQQHPFCGHASSTRSLSIRPFLLSRTAAARFRGPLDPSCSIYSSPRLALQAAASLTYRPSPPPSCSVVLVFFSASILTVLDDDDCKSTAK